MSHYVHSSSRRKNNNFVLDLHNSWGLFLAWEPALYCCLQSFGSFLWSACQSKRSYQPSVLLILLVAGVLNSSPSLSPLKPAFPLIFIFLSCLWIDSSLSDFRKSCKSHLSKALGCFESLLFVISGWPFSHITPQQCVSPYHSCLVTTH